MTTSILKSKKDWLCFKQLLERKLDGYKFSDSHKEPTSFPCIAVGNVNFSMVNGFSIDYLFFFAEDLNPLTKRKNKSKLKTVKK